MILTYFIRDKRGLREVPPKDLDKYFTAIFRLTGLDRHLAEAILAEGSPIEHPTVTFTALKYGKVHRKENPS